MPVFVPVLLVFLLVVAIIFFGVLPLLQWLNTNEQEAAEYTAVKEVAVIRQEQPQQEGQEQDAPEMIIDFDALKDVNPDVVGWLYIPDTPVDYPVVGTDSLKYLKRGFSGKRNASGALFVYGEADYFTPQQNITIFGHNMGRGRDVMFGSLLKYKDEEYFNQHQTLYFYTPFDNLDEYRLIAAFNTKSTDDISYTQTCFTGDEFFSFIRSACERGGQAFPEIGADSRIITLSTCDGSYGGSSGRFVVIAVKIQCRSKS